MEPCGKEENHENAVPVKRFRETKNRCFSLVITERDLADLVLSGLRTPIREKLEGYEFLNINQVLQRALAQESRSKDLKEVHRYKALCKTWLIFKNSYPSRFSLMGVLKPLSTRSAKSLSVITKLKHRFFVSLNLLT